MTQPAPSAPPDPAPRTRKPTRAELRAAAPKRAPKPPVVHLRQDVHPTELTLLRDLAVASRRVRGWTPADAPERLAAQEFARRLAQLRANGVPFLRVARSLNLTKRALDARLERNPDALSFPPLSPADLARALAPTPTPTPTTATPPTQREDATA